MSEDLRKKIQVSKLPPMMSGGPKMGTSRGPKDYTSVPWNKYYTRRHDIIIDKDTFRVYELGDTGPVCLFLHGGGFSALSWALLCKSLCGIIACRCVAMDSRGHGETKTTDDGSLSADIQARDIGRVVNQLYGDDPPPIVLIGHSMGGAMAVHTVSANIVPSVIALIVIDVVEGTALDALSGMQTFLRGRPSNFQSLERAIEYCVRSGQIKNVESARVSVIGQMQKLSGVAVAGSGSCLSVKDPVDNKVTGTDVIKEEQDEEVANGAVDTAAKSSASNQATSSQFQTPAACAYGWRIDLSKTDKFWKGWFEGTSKMFLSCGVPKLLILAGVDRLDKELTVGQMQGKFQMQVLPQCGHVVHEDSPEKVSEAIATFLTRNRLVESIDGFQKTFPGC